MSTSHQFVESAYEAALLEERLAWKRLDQPPVDVNEHVKACAEWSAAAERARAIGRRLAPASQGQTQA
ncbi:hypothetical protein [Ramlibacter sp.]|uniref:hypothetical protein n=1 Tax=Ramlibacter sp. TaxID=1917967 RepID=UPI002CB054ED|nr:hypothetical protein [Ramlibacter sp.]HWI81999.1 hypothetical protein [Ramlibacter sp.]